MDPVRNPFAPGAGSHRPELAGRNAILGDAKIAIARALIGKQNRSQMLLGLRGVGKSAYFVRTGVRDCHRSVGGWPVSLSDIAAALGETSQSLGPRRSQIISKGMIYSPSREQDSIIVTEGPRESTGKIQPLL